MSDEVLIAYGEDAGKTATLLLGAAEELYEGEPWRVRNQPEDGGFRVPADVAEKAGLDPEDEGDGTIVNSEPEPEKPAKKTAAKKTTAKKAAAKKTSSK